MRLAMTAKAIWLDGEMLSWADANVHVTTHALHYGIGFFEGLRCHSTPDGPAIFRLTDHLRRLARSAAVYGVTLPHSPEALAQACRDVVLANGYEECYLRPIVFLGEGPNPLAAPFRAAVIAVPHGPLAGPPSGAGVRAKVSSFQRLPANVLPPAAKATGQYLNSFLAQTEARAAGCDEALLLNAQGYVTDGWVHNVFVAHNGVLATPPTSAGALPGITRDSLLRLAAEEGIEVAERQLVRSDLYVAEECFLTGTAAGVVPVTSVDGRTVGDGNRGILTARLGDLFGDVATGRDPRHPEWREPV
jgi:branched-chain amino acid aminotransferase